ncbi:condensation domain-containing protein, partial [Streptomyces lavendulae]|uniref:condensation domain-containing protein n=1 Tax=Streptomyces lavendulae TaxID=1914 RepID=UPI0036E8A6B6
GAIRSAGFQVAVQDVFEHRTVAELARHVAGQNTPVEAVELVRPFALIDPLDREMLPGSAVDAYPVSQVQLGMLVEMSLGEERAAYHNVDVFRIRDDRPFDAEALQRATDELTSRHEVLRTGFDLTGYSVPLQIVHAAVEATVGVVDLTGLDEAARKEAAAACENEQRTTPFNTAVPPLIRVNALVHEDTDWQLVFTHAHPILEGWSYHSLLTELLDLYRTFRDGGRPESATGEGSRFADFIAAEQESVGAGADRAYWQRIVADNASFSVPAGWGDGTVAEGTAFRIPIPVHDLEERLRAFAGRARVSMKSVLLGAHLKVMSQLTEETAFHTGLVCDTRPELPGADRVYGLHLNTVPFPFNAGRSATWGELVAQVFDQETELWPHRRYPLPAIQRDAGGTRLLDVYFNYQDFSKVDGDEVDELGDIDEVPTEFPLMVATRSGYIVLTTDGRSVSRANAERIAAMYRLVLEGMAADGGGDARAVLLPAG